MSKETFIKSQLQKVTETISKMKEIHHISHNIDLCVASKYASAEEIRILYDAGCRIFGENRVQDALLKQQELSDLDIEWHFIGHLQSNKINKVLSSFDVIQSLDRWDLIDHIEKKCKHNQQSIKGFLQFNTGNDPNKQGFNQSNITTLTEKIATLDHISIEGIMLIAPLLDQKQSLESIFKDTKKIYDNFQKKYGKIQVLSMGMSNDFDIAIEMGATMVRVGRYLFKE